jgi:FkbM family methyltransferase
MTVSDPQLLTLDLPGQTAPLQLYIHGVADRQVSRRLREEGVWEPYETSLVLAALAPGDTFLDVGANIGYFSLLAARQVGASGAVFAFEPDPLNYALLRASIAANDLATVVRPMRAALAAKDGDGHLHLSEDNLGDHKLHHGAGDRARVPVSLLAGAAYLAPRLDRLRMVKIDTQGSEYLVLQGLMPLLVAMRPRADILIEVTPLSLREAGHSGRQLIDLLATLGQPFWIVDHIEHRLVRSSAVELADWCDGVDAVPGDAGFMNILLAESPAGA